MDQQTSPAPVAPAETRDTRRTAAEARRRPADTSSGAAGWRPRRRLVAAGLAGIAFALAFPHPGWWPLAVPALGVLFALFATATPRRAMLEAFLGGGLFFGVMLRWFHSVLSEFTSLGSTVAWGAVVASGIIMGACTALVAWLIARVARRFGTGVALAAAPFTWVAYEVARERVPFPFPWGTLAGAAGESTIGPPAAALVGAHGLSLLLALGAATVAAWLVRPRGTRRPAVVGFAIWAGLVLAVVLGGRHAATRLGDARPVRAAVLQGSVPEASDEQSKLLVYERLTRDAARAGAAIVVWPESAVRYRVDGDPLFRTRMEELANDLGIDLVLGSVTGTKGAYFNSDVLVHPERGLAEIQPKRRLVPFGEYLPMRWLFGRVPAIAWEMGEDFKAGDEAVVLAGRAAPMGALVCFEAVYPGLTREFGQKGVTVLVNTTNDSWFGTSAGPAQHLRLVVLRSAETGRPMLRAANTGISAIVDRHGIVRQRLGLTLSGLLVADIVPGVAMPPGSAVGQAVRWLCAIVAAAALFAALFLRRGGPRTSATAPGNGPSHA